MLPSNTDPGRPVPGFRRALAAWLPLLLILGGGFVLPQVSGSPPVVLNDDSWLRGDDVRLERFEAHVQVHDQLANTTLEFAFGHDEATGREVQFVVPLPPNAALTGFTLETEEQVLVGIVQERHQARQTYDEAKAAGRDAVLLEEADDERLSLSVHVPAGADRVLTVSFLEHLDVQSGARTYRLETSRLGALTHPVPVVALTLDVYSASGIRALSLPGVALDVTLDQPGHVRAERIHHDVHEMDDLVALWIEGEGVWSSTLVTSTSPSGPSADDAAFLASIHYRPENATEPLPRDIVFVLDTSGSMGGNKIVQARDSIREVLFDLRPDDRFGVVLFGNEANVLTPELQPAAGDEVAAMRDRLAHVEAAGSTNLDAGVQEALKLLGDAPAGRVPLVVMLSDGMPTTGVTSHPQIVARLHAANTVGAAVHIIAIGLDADDSFLEDMAGQSGGSLTLLQPGDDLQDRLADFYATLGDPLLTDVRVTIEGVDHSGLYPNVMPSLYRDDTLRVVFRADVADAPGLYVRVTGLSADGMVDERFAFGTSSMPVMPEVDRVWGADHVQALLARERRDGTDDQLRAAIIGNATMYGVVTSYTSWVIADSAVAGSTPTSTAYPTTPASGDTADTAARQAYPSSTTDPTAPTVPPVPTEPADGDTGGDDEPDEEATPAPGLVVVLLVVAWLAMLVRRRRV